MSVCGELDSFYGTMVYSHDYNHINVVFSNGHTCGEIIQLHN